MSLKEEIKNTKVGVKQVKKETPKWLRIISNFGLFLGCIVTLFAGILSPTVIAIIGGVAAAIKLLSNLFGKE